MRHEKLFKTSSSLNSMRNMFSIIGVFSVLFILISWAFPAGKNNDQQLEFSTPAPDVNIAKEGAVLFINAYRDRYFKNEQNVPKGFFISRAAIKWLLENEEYNGIYVYPALNAEGNVCSILEGGVSAVNTFRVIEGIEGRQIVNESMCPTDCGGLMK